MQSKFRSEKLLPNLSSSFAERITGLMHREKQTRFAGGALGYLWAYLTPIAWITFVVLAFELLGRQTPIAVPHQLFVATGILPYILFRQTITAMMRSLKTNRYMVYFQPVSTAEILLSAALMEILNMLLISTVIFASIIVIFDTPMPNDTLKVVIGIGTAWFLAAGFGRFSAVLAQISDTYGRAVPVVLRPTFWISGVFFTATELPNASIEVLWYSPLFHSIEIVREGFFLNYQSPISEPMVPFFTGMIFFTLSTYLEAYWKTSDARKGLL